MNPHPDLTTSVIRGLGWLYLILFAMNVFWTWRLARRHAPVLSIGAWATYASLLAMFGFAHVTGGADPERFLVRMPVFLKDRIDLLADARIYFALSIALFAFVIWFREQLVKPTVAWVLLNLSILFMALSLTDYDFRQIVGKPDNVPIVSMLFIVAFFTWLYFRRAVENDHRIAQGKPLLEQDDNEKVLVWPDLVYSEMICMVILTAVLVVWGVVLQAPLEEPASAVKTPNPSKAPWYFLGLQEMLVYYDPWMAGVVLPSVILVGLMALPYIDFNKKGNGYYTFNERKFSISVFLFGFLPLWIGLIILGTFLRGPNWNFFGIYEFWDVHKLEVLNNVNLSEIVWVDQFKQPLPVPSADAGELGKIGTILKRESVGLVLVAGYLFVLPFLMAITVFRRFFFRMGFIRYMVFANLVLFMACLPIKMVLRWAFNLKYIVAIPEWFFNI
jgi:Cytochrome b(C-terminal)/b6/petD